MSAGDISSPMHSTTHVMLLSKGAPPDHRKLNVEWLQDTAEPFIHGVPHFVNVKEKLHLFRNSSGMWTISPEVDAGVAFAIARTTALHPNTIRAGEWQLPGKKEWASTSSFKVCIEGPNTEECPYDVKKDLGEDFFLRVRTTKVIWFRDPSTGEVVHSGAKASGSSKRLGKRYCPLCEQCYSANNFVSQHVKNMHTPPAPTMPKCYADGKGGVQIIWRADDFPEGARAVSFFVQFSIDGGEKWSTGIEDTHSAEPRAYISSLSQGVTYAFRVGAIGLAAQGRLSEPSLPFNPEQAAILMNEAPLQLPHPPTHAYPSPTSAADLANGGSSQAALPNGSQLLATKPSEPSGQAGQLAPQLPPTGLTVVTELKLRDSGSPSPSQPSSPPLTPPSVTRPQRSSSLTSNGHSIGGSKRGHTEVGGAGSSSKAGESLAAIDLMWSLDDLCREAMSAEEEGERAFERLFGASKRSRVSSGGAHSDEMLEYLYGSLGGTVEPMAISTAPNATAPIYRSLDHLAQHNPREESIARLTRGPIDIANSMSRDQVIAAATSYKAQEAVAAGSRRASSGTGDQMAKPSSTDGHDATQKLVRLRQALVAAPPRAKNLLLTPTLLATLVKAPHHRRELSLLLTHASHTTIEAAAADSIVLEHEIHSFRQARPPPPTIVVPTFALRRVAKRIKCSPVSLRPSAIGGLTVVIMVLSVLVATLLPEVHSTVVASALSLSQILPPPGLFSPPPPPPPACHWSWRAGCTPSNVATVGCRLDMRPSRPLCNPERAADLA